jgi:23S rRNA (uridine2552-2'-O)-methyltransferase
MKYHLHDAYFRKAKQEGYRSRAAYKLLDLQQRFRIFRPGDAVIDLGAAPGGWLQVTANFVGPTGMVVGVDLQPIEGMPQQNVVFIEADIAARQTAEKIRERLGRPADCVISDLSPKLSGIRDADDARCAALNRTALRVAIRLLRPGGSFLVKSFVSEKLRAFSSEIEKHFRSVRGSRPDASRKGSSEIYLFARELKSMPAS